MENLFGLLRSKIGEGNMGKKITLNEAIELIDKSWKIDLDKLGKKHVYSKGSIYNAIHEKKLSRSGPPHIVMVDADEVLKLFGPKKAG